ncbi:MsnO8 family LLM class oxidoreductase [Aerococcus kribbianus]|uniref:MsnO8 family LLM class oxidoreductase n=1 Tax=Aerococcus kribbianus TaxID=2999064 RepID=A0A9X3FME9_9LACT|nr:MULTISPECIES: MsnO8 family LLM class oxidoreductase [unclassified Aerococcus]MCZ0717165.1 MsnO8 family LLM class oxidoreductase [Aerococcus sp. YH-aer221]MCZ0725453.1 MsnO8 family LLM class oxidoreductase [Aerococcus sp. YH-aer222]
MSSKIGILDMIPRDHSTSVQESFINSTRLAQTADEVGLQRYWVSEHHSTPAVISNSPLVMVAHLAAHTKRIKLGTGAVMMNNLSPFQIAENFRVLHALYPDRIEAGIGHSVEDEVNFQLDAGVIMGTDEDYREGLKDTYRFMNGSFDEADPRHKLQVLPLDFSAAPNLSVMVTGLNNVKFIAKNGWGMVYGLFITGDIDQCREAIRIYKANFQANGHRKKPEATVALYAVSAYQKADIKPLNLALNEWIKVFPDNKRNMLQLMSMDQARDESELLDKDAEDPYENYKVVGTPRKVQATLRRMQRYLKCTDFLIINQLSGFQNRRDLIKILGDVSLL